MADLFVDPSFFQNNGGGPVQSYTGNPEIDRELSLMPEDERQAALAEITAPPSGEEIADMVSRKMSAGEVPNMTIEDYRLYKAYIKNKEVDVMESIGMGAEMVFNDLQRAAGAAWDDPANHLAKLTPSIIEAFAQGTRGLYGMLAQSQDPSSTLFRVKNALTADGSDEQAEFQQFMDALDFNAKSTRLMTGKETIVMDKDLINPEMTQAMSYIADPTLFIPFGGVAAKGARLVGMSEGLAKAAARAEAIKSMVLGGAVKWGVGAPIEFIGGATRTVIDGAVERGSRLIEAGTGLSAKELESTARLSGLGTVASGLAGFPVSGLTDVSGAYIGATGARGLGEAIGAVGEQMMKGPRGVRSYAAQALRESAGNLTPHAQNLLKVIDTFDPMFSYSGDIISGVAQGAAIGAGLGYLSGGQEGMAQGIGAGGVLGGTGAAFGRIIADTTGATRRERMRITDDLVLNGLKDLNPEKYKDFMTLKAVADAKGVDITGYIGGFDTLTPDLDTYFRTLEQHKDEIRAKGYDPEKYDGSFVDENGHRLFSVQEFSRAEGYVVAKAKDGNIRLGINLDNLKKNTVPHESFHAVFRSVLMEPEFQRRMTENVLGVFDKSGKMIEPPRVSKEDALGFFNRYLSALYKGDKLKEKQALLNQALTEYYRDGQTTVMDSDGKTPFLNSMSEEFGAYYFTQFIQGKPVDYLYLGGQYTGIRGLIESAKEGWIDYWESKTKQQNPRFDINNPDGIDYAFKPKGGKRVRVSALDYMMRDLIRAAEATNRDGSVNLNRMSQGSRESFARANGLDGVLGEKKGVFRRPSAKGGVDSVKVYNKTYGKEVHKAIAAMPDNLRPQVDGDGNFVGPLSKEVLDQMVSTGFVSREMANKISLLQDMASGKMDSNLAEMGYIGWSMQTDVGPNPPRVYGDEVPYKRRRVLVLGVESKIGPKGMSFTAKTLDFKVIEARANNLWADSNVRRRWNDNRSEFIQDFFRYLDNASKTQEQGRVPSAQLWAEDGAAKRDIMHQMAGFPRQNGDTFAHAPIAEVHEDILNSVMNLTVNRMTDVRVTGDKVNFNAEQANPFIRVNMKVAEMDFEDTPNGRVYTDKQSGFKFTEEKGRITAYDRNGERIGTYSSKEEAQRLTMRVYERQQRAMKEMAGTLEEASQRGITFKSRAQFINDNTDIAIKSWLDSKISAESSYTNKDYIVASLQRAIGHLVDEQGNPNKTLIDTVNAGFSESSNALAQANILKKLKDGETIDAKELAKAFHPNVVDANGNFTGKTAKPSSKGILFSVESPDGKTYIKLDRHIEDIQLELNRAISRNFVAWNSQLPQTFRSGLLDKIKALHKQNPNLTNQGLLKKLLRDGSTGSRFWAEAEAIGLIKHLREQISPVVKIQKIRDAQGNWTGGVKEVAQPVGFKSAGVDIITGGKMEPVDIAGIENFIKDNAITLTPEIGAREVSGYNTSQSTADGEKTSYNETAIRINKKYAHGIRGHYGEDVIAHHRSTLRPDINGEQVRFVEEIQANNAKEEKVDPAELNRVKAGLEAQNKALAIGDKYGIWTTTEQGDAGLNLHRLQLRNFETRASVLNIKGVDLMNAPDIGGFRADEVVIPIMRQYHVNLDDSINQIPNGSYIQSVDAFLDSVLRDPAGIVPELGRELGTAATTELAEKAIKFIRSKNGLMEDLKVGRFHAEKLYNAIQDAAKEYSKLERIVNPLRTAEQDLNQNRYAFTTLISDGEIRIQQMEKSVGREPLPLQEISEWGAVAVKDIIRQATMNGDDKIALTHPDDTPAQCGMAPEARNANYGRIFPDIIRKIVEPFGIEVRVRNELGERALQSPDVVKATNAKIKAQQSSLDLFNKHGSGESPDVINPLAQLLAKPVHEVAKDLDGWIRSAERLVEQVKNDEFKAALEDVVIKAGEEAELWGSAHGSAEILIPASAELIDRAVSFELNDEIKKAVRQGDFFTAYKPDDTGEQGGRRYTDEQFNKEFIGKFASENPELANKFLIRIKENDGGTMEDWQYKMVIYDKETKKAVARTKWQLFENEDGILEDAAADVEILSDAYKGMKLSHLMQSERLERSRFLGAEGVRSQITNEEGIPIKNYAKTIGAEKGEITSALAERYDEEGKTKYIPATMENFKQEMDLSKAHADKTWKPTVYYRAKIDPNAWYKPSEGQPLRENFSPDERKAKIDRFNEIKAIVLKKYSGTLNQRDAIEYASLMREAQGIQFELRAGRGLKLENIPSMESRKSNLPSDIVKVASDELASNRKIHDILGEVAQGVYHNQDTVVDDVFNGKNKEVSPQEFYAAFEKTRQALRQRFGDTIELYRAQGKQKEKYTQLWASSKEIAGNYGTNIEKRSIPIDNILALNVGLRGGYEEFFVGNKPPETKPLRENFSPDYQGGDDYWKPKKNIFESKDEKGFLIRALSVYDEKQNKYLDNPESLDWMDIGHSSDDKVAGMWYVDDITRKVEHANVSEYTTHEDLFSDMGEEHLLKGRIEYPVYKQGKLIKRGRISIAEPVDGFAPDLKGLNELKSQVVKSYKLKSGDVDAYYFGSDEDLKAAFGLSYRDQLPIKFKVDDEVKKNLRSLQSAIDRQADMDKVPKSIRAGVGRLIQAVERQRREDIKTVPANVKDGFRALARAVDEQADMDKVPAAVRQGLRKLFEAAQYEDLKPQRPMPKATASEEQLASGLEALGRAVGVQGKVRRSEPPVAQARPQQQAPVAQPKAPDVAPTAPRSVDQPSSSVWRSWTHEKTAEGSVYKSAVGYMIMVHKGKFKLYNPYNSLVGIYTDIESAKRRMLRDEPKQ